jgi:hypothetical protein
MTVGYQINRTSIAPESLNLTNELYFDVTHTCHPRGGNHDHRDGAVQLLRRPSMILHVPNVLNGEQVARCAVIVEMGGWPRHRPPSAKNNLNFGSTGCAGRLSGPSSASRCSFQQHCLAVFPPIFNTMSACRWARTGQLCEQSRNVPIPIAATFSSANLNMMVASW